MGEVIILDKVFPEYQVHAKFISYHLNRALGLDAKLSSHPIEVECPDANKANQVGSVARVETLKSIDENSTPDF